MRWRWSDSNKTGDAMCKSARMCVRVLKSVWECVMAEQSMYVWEMTLPFRHHNGLWVRTVDGDDQVQNLYISLEKMEDNNLNNKKKKRKYLKCTQRDVGRERNRQREENWWPFPQLFCVEFDFSAALSDVVSCMKSFEWKCVNVNVYA